MNLLSLSHVPCNVLFDTRHSLCGTDDRKEIMQSMNNKRRWNILKIENDAIKLYFQTVI